MTVLSKFISKGKSTDREERPLRFLPLHGDTAEERATNLLNRTGCRMWLEGDQVVIGYWPDLDGPELRAALRTACDTAVLRSLEHADARPDRTIRKVARREPGNLLAEWLATNREAVPNRTGDGL